MYQTSEPQNTYKKKLTELKGKIDSSAIIVGDFNVSLSIMDRHSYGRSKRK